MPIRNKDRFVYFCNFILKILGDFRLRTLTPCSILQHYKTATYELIRWMKLRISIYTKRDTGIFMPYLKHGTVSLGKYPSAVDSTVGFNTSPCLIQVRNSPWFNATPLNDITSQNISLRFKEILMHWVGGLSLCRAFRDLLRGSKMRFNIVKQMYTIFACKSPDGCFVVSLCHLLPLQSFRQIYDLLIPLNSCYFVTYYSEKYILGILMQASFISRNFFLL